MTTVREIEVQGAGGPLTLEVAEAGTGRPLLLVHGFTGAKEDFGDWMDAIAAAGWHVVAPDQRGHGGSDQPDDEGAYTLDAFASDLLALLDALGWERAVVLGHSMGGMVVQTAALRAPERFEALILMDTSHRGLKVDPEVVELGIAIARNDGLAAVMAAQEAIQDPLASGAHERVLAERPGYREFGETKMLASSPAMYSAMLHALTDRTSRIDRLAELPSISVPALVIVGEQDEAFIKPSIRMAEAIPDAELVVIPDAGHSPQFENPQAWWAALSMFLARI